MTRRHIARIIGVVLAAVTLVGCSAQSPVTPSASRDRDATHDSQPAVSAATPQTGGPSGTVTALATGGSYDLSFLDTNLRPVTTLAVGGEELVLGAHVADSSGAPAQSGSVTFEYCSYRRRPPNDITRADEAPSAACTNGSATWKGLRMMKVDRSGNAYLNFGFVQIPRTVGFRFRYSGAGGIAKGMSAEKDFTWVAS